MAKIRLQYDEFKQVCCDYGIAKLMILIGPFYPMMKNDYYISLIVLMTQIAVTILFFIFIPFNVAILISAFTIFVINLLFALNYNDIVIEYYLKKGYVPCDYESSNTLLKKGIYFKLR